MTFKWVKQEILTSPPNAAHLLHHYDVWCVANDKDEILIFKDYYLQGNQHKSIAERFVLRNKDQGAIKVIHLDHVFLVDSPNRYV